MIKAVINMLNSFPKKLVLLADQAIVSGSSFVLNIVLVWLLGLENYGVFAVLWMLLMGILAMQQALFTLPMLSFAPKMDVGEQRLYMWQLMLLQQLILLVTISVAAVVVWLVKSQLGIAVLNIELLLVWAVWVFLYCSFDFIRKCNFLNGAVSKNLIIDACVFVIQLIGLGVFYLFVPTNLFGVIGLLALSYLVVSLIPLLKSVLYIKSISVFSIFKLHYNFSKWLVGKNVLQWFTANYFVLFAGAILGPAIVGVIRLIQNVLGLLHVVFLAMENEIPIKASVVYKNDGGKGMAGYLVKSSVQYGLVLLPIIGLIALFPSQLLGLIYQQDYSDFGLLASVYALSYLIVFFAYPFRFALRTIERTQGIFMAYLIAAIFSYLSASLLIKSFGMYGVVIGLAAVQLISIAVYCIYLFPKILKDEDYSFRFR